MLLICRVLKRKDQKMTHPLVRSESVLFCPNAGAIPALICGMRQARGFQAPSLAMAI